MEEPTPAVHWLTLIVVCLLLPGCGADSDLARVKGKVTFHGQPLPGAIVQFQPRVENGSASAGITDSEGRYELMHTFNTPGVMPGEHVVTIRTAATYYDESDSPIAQPERIPAKYNSQTELERVVAPGRNTIDFEL